MVFSCEAAFKKRFIRKTTQMLIVCAQHVYCILFWHSDFVRNRIPSARARKHYNFSKLFRRFARHKRVQGQNVKLMPIPVSIDVSLHMKFIISMTANYCSRFPSAKFTFVLCKLTYLSHGLPLFVVCDMKSLLIETFATLSNQN